MSKKKTSGGREPQPFTFERLKETYRQDIGAEFPGCFYPDPVTERLSEEDRESYCVSEAGARAPLVPVLPGNLEEAPQGTWLAGFWGYGANSCAYYFVRKNERSHVFLRLPYGGAYGNTGQDAAQVRAFVERYAAFERWALENDIWRWKVDNNMGSVTGWIKHNPSVRESFVRANQRDFRFPNEAGYAPGVESEDEF